jgi:hypothetical protein
MRYAKPNTPGSKVQYRTRYDNFIGGEWVVRPKQGQYFENISPVTGKPFCEVARSTAEDIEVALDAAHGAKDAWGKTSVAERSAALLNKIADRMEQNLEMLAVPRPGTTASRCARRWPPTCRWRSTTSATSPAACAPGRAHGRARRQHRRLPLPRAARRRRADHPVELPAADGGVEARAGAGRRQLRGAQAGRADAGDDLLFAELIGDLLPRACSTSSTASASRPASRSRQSPASPRSRSPARPRPAG